MILLSDLNLPSPPKAAMQLVELCQDPYADIQEIETVISTDASLAAKLLKVANSVYYGQQHEVASLHRAVIVLGAEHVKVVALGFHLAEMTQSWRDLPFDLKAYWQGNVLRACLCRQLAFRSQRAPTGCQAEAFLAGLLQDLAVPIMAREVGEPYTGWSPGAGLYTTAQMLALEEEAVEGDNHASLAGRICELWNFPERITFAIQKHHTTPQKEDTSNRNMMLWQLAYFVGAIPFNVDQSTTSVSTSLRHLALAAFALDTTKLGEAFYGAIEDYESLRPVFDGMLPHDIHASAVLDNARQLAADLAQADIPGHSS